MYMYNTHIHVHVCGQITNINTVNFTWSGTCMEIHVHVLTCQAVAFCCRSHSFRQWETC